MNKYAPFSNLKVHNKKNIFMQLLLAESKVGIVLGLELPNLNLKP